VTLLAERRRASPRVSLVDIDERLPFLPAALAEEMVRQRFAAHWPGEPAWEEPPDAVEACTRCDTHYEPGARCDATYRLVARSRQGTRRTTFGVVEVTPQGLTHRLYADDARLEDLRVAADAHRMHPRLDDLLGGVDDCRVVPVRYKPAQRCVLRYEARSSNGRHVLFGKMVAHHAQELASRLLALAALGSTTPNAPTVQAPLAGWPDLQLVVQPAVQPAVEVHDVAFDARVREARGGEWLREAGRRIAGLHASPGVEGPVRSIHDDLVELRSHVPVLRQVDRSLARRFVGAITAIEAAADAGMCSEAVASHGALRTDAFLLSRSTLVLIDLDGFCWAEASRDIGNLLAYLDWKILRQPGIAAHIVNLAGAFLDGYASVRDLPDPRRLALYRAVTALRIIGRRYRKLVVAEWPLSRQLLDRACALVEGGGGAAIRVTDLPAHRGGTAASPPLPAVRTALDPKTMTPLLCPLLASREVVGAEARIIRAVLLAQKPAHRAVVRYDVVDGAEEECSTVIYGKVYGELPRAVRSLEAQHRLWSEVFTDPRRFGVPEPLGYVSSPPLLVYRPVRGVSLDRLIASPEVLPALESTARWLAQLHSSRVVLERRFDLEAECQSLASWPAVIGRHHDDLAEHAGRLCQRLRQQARTDRLGLHTPIHHDLHYQHVVVDEGLEGLHVLDLDEMRMGDPNFDLGHFCAYLDLLALRSAPGMAWAVDLRSAFLRTYAALTGWAPDERLAWSYWYGCLKIARQLSTGRGPHPRPRGQEQHRQARGMLLRGLTTPGLM
jgi:aminoglycoside phosphotransferase (APT) family kinase protein